MPTPMYAMFCEKGQTDQYAQAETKRDCERSKYRANVRRWIYRACTNKYVTFTRREREIRICSRLREIVEKLSSGKKMRKGENAEDNLVSSHDNISTGETGQWLGTAEGKKKRIQSDNSASTEGHERHSAGKRLHSKKYPSWLMILLPHLCRNNNLRPISGLQPGA